MTVVAEIQPSILIIFFFLLCNFDSIMKPKEGTSNIQWSEEMITELDTVDVGTAFWIALLKEIGNGREDEGENVSSYWITLTL